MVSSPSIDLGLMAEHLAALEDVINKLELYQITVTNLIMKEINELQANVMREQTRIMLALINSFQKDKWGNLFS